MKIMTEYPNGVLSWVDLSTTDTDDAKGYCGRLFGWEFEDQPIDVGGTFIVIPFNGPASPPPGH